MACKKRVLLCENDRIILRLKSIFVGQHNICLYLIFCYVLNKKYNLDISIGSQI